MAETVVIQSCFHLLPSKKLYEVRLTRKKLVYQQTSIDSCCYQTNSPSFWVDLDDIYGAKVFRSTTRHDTNSYLHVYTCTVKGKKRVQRRIRFKVGGWEDVDANIREAERWMKTILWLIQDRSVDISTIKDRSLPAQRKLLVLVNPYSGSGKSLRIFYNNVVPMFTEACVDYTLLVTGYAGHAEKIAQDLNVEEFDGVVICSGDGLVHEFINGLMKRSDWSRAISIPLGVIPTGSGNALCYSALYASGEPFTLTAAIFGVIRGQTLDLDICTIQTPSQKIYSFLSLTWGMISDVDIESEKYRCLGNARFTLGAIIRILDLRMYSGRLSYLPPDDDQPTATNSIDVPQNEQQNEDLSNFHSLPGSPSGSFYPDNCTTEEKQEKTFNHDNNVGMLNNAHPSINDESYCNPTTLSLTKPLPSNWKTIEGEFILGCSVLLSHLDANCNFVPDAEFGDGLLYLAWIKSGASKMRLISILGEMETGVHVESDDFIVIKARAFRLEPDLSQAGTIAVDGERIPYSAVQGEVLKGLGRVMCSKNYNKN